MYQQKKGMKPKEIHEDMLQILPEDYPSYTTLKKWAMEFKRTRYMTENDPQSGRLKTSTTDE